MLDMAPDMNHVQFIKDGVHFYMPSTFHTSPTMKSISLSNNNTNGSVLDEIISQNGNHVPLLLNQVQCLKKLKNVYYHNYNSYERMNVHMYLNWPMRDISILGKVMDIREADFDEYDVDFGFISIDNGTEIKIPNGAIKSNEYLLIIEDGTSQKSLTVRMSPQIWNYMQVNDKFKLKLGSKVKISGVVNINHTQLELLATNGEIVGDPQDLSVETDWWKLCLKTKALLEQKWQFNSLLGIEYPDLDIIISFTERQNIVDLIDDDCLMEGGEYPMTNWVWVDDLDCSFDDYLNLTLSTPIDVPNNDDIDAIIFERLLDLSLAESQQFTLESIQKDKHIYHALIKAITSTMIETWSVVTDDKYLDSRWKYTDFKSCTYVLLKQHLDQFIDLEIITESSETTFSLNILIEVMKVVVNKLNLLPISSTIAVDDIQVLLREIGVTFKDKYVECILNRAIAFNTDKEGTNWKSTFNGWEKGYVEDQSIVILSDDYSLGLHNRLTIPTTELIKCSIFQMILKEGTIDMGSIISNDEIKVKLNTLIFAKISDTCGSIHDLNSIIDVLAVSRGDFDMMKRRILVAIILLFESSHILEIQYDGFLDRQALVDYSFNTITIQCLIDLHELIIPQDDFKTKEIRTSLNNYGVKINTLMTNCLIDNQMQINQCKSHFVSKKSEWLLK